jgi:hypothetical protein
MIRRNTWILVGILVVLVAVAWIVQRSSNNTQAGATPTSVVSNFFNTEDHSIVGMRISNAAGEAVEMKKGPDGSWSLIQPQDEEADTSRIESGVTQAEGLQVISSLNSDLSLDVIGLDPAAYEISVTYDDASSQLALIGSKTPTGSGYYAKMGDEPIQVVSPYSVEGILDLLNNPPIKPTPTPSIEPEVTPTMSP